MPWFTVYYKDHPQDDFVSAEEIDASNKHEALTLAKSEHPRAVEVRVLTKAEHTHIEEFIKTRD